MAPLPPIRVLRITALPEGFEELAADAVADGQKMLEILREDWASGATRFDGPGEALFAALAGEALLGLGGVTRDPYAEGEAAGREAGVGAPHGEDGAVDDRVGGLADVAEGGDVREQVLEVAPDARV